MFTIYLVQNMHLSHFVFEQNLKKKADQKLFKRYPNSGVSRWWWWCIRVSCSEELRIQRSWKSFWRN